MAPNPDELVVHRRKRRPSLRGVAEKVGVSHTAVAMALRGDPSIGSTLRKRILAIAEEEGYVVSDVMRSLLTGSSGTVGVVVPYVSNPFLGALVESIITALWEQSIVPLLLCSHLNLAQEERAIQALAAKRADGLIIIPTREDRGEAHFMRLIENHTPILAVDSPLPEIAAPLIASDDDRASQDATRHLLSRGHRHILYLSGVIDSRYADRRRELGYQHVMQQAGLKPTILHAPHRLARVEDVAPMLEQFFGTTEGRKTTAVFCMSDSFAYCVYAVATKLGRVIGRDLAVMGFGNVNGDWAVEPIAADIISPTLSTVDQHPSTWGPQIVEVLQRMAEGEPVPQQTLIQCDLVIRQSSDWQPIPA